MAWTKSSAIAMSKPERNGLRKRLSLINGGSFINNGDKDSTSIYLLRYSCVTNNRKKVGVGRYEDCNGFYLRYRVD